jgi:MtN3 and saliva related transmembrane protein
LKRRPECGTTCRAAGDRHIAASNQTYVVAAMTLAWVDVIGVTGAVLTTVCWLPQAVKIIRDKDTRAISLLATIAFTTGIAFWLAYGVALVDWPLIGSNVITLALMLVILALKLGTAELNPAHDMHAPFALNTRSAAIRRPIAEN